MDLRVTNFSKGTRGTGSNGSLGGPEVETNLCDSVQVDLGRALPDTPGSPEDTRAVVRLTADCNQAYGQSPVSASTREGKCGNGMSEGLE